METEDIRRIEVRRNYERALLRAEELKAQGLQQDLRRASEKSLEEGRRFQTLCARASKQALAPTSPRLAFDALASGLEQLRQQKKVLQLTKGVLHETRQAHEKTLAGVEAHRHKLSLLDAKVAAWSRTEQRRNAERQEEDLHDIVGAAHGREVESRLEAMGSRHDEESPLLARGEVKGTGVADFGEGSSVLPSNFGAETPLPSQHEPLTGEDTSHRHGSGQESQESADSLRAALAREGYGSHVRAGDFAAQLSEVQSSHEGGRVAVQLCYTAESGQSVQVRLESNEQGKVHVALAAQSLAQQRRLGRHLEQVCEALAKRGLSVTQTRSVP